MENLETNLTQTGFHIEGFPDASKVIKVHGPKAQRIADFALHRSDLLIALESLEGINSIAPEMRSVRQSLWRSAIVHCIKCFTDSKSRSGLDPKKVFKGHSVALEVYEYFRALRNKHVAHDENSYLQCIPGAVLNKPGAEYKVAKIV